MPSINVRLMDGVLNARRRHRSHKTGTDVVVPIEASDASSEMAGAFGRGQPSAPGPTPFNSRVPRQ